MKNNNLENSSLTLENYWWTPDLVECLMFTGSMSKAERDVAYDRLTATATGKDPNLKEVKLCYATVRPLPRHDLPSLRFI